MKYLIFIALIGINIPFAVHGAVINILAIGIIGGMAISCAIADVA